MTLEKKHLEKILINLLPLLITLNFLLILVYFILNTQRYGIGEKVLIDILPIFFTLDFSLILILFFLNLSEFKNPFRDIKRKTWFFLLLVIILGFILRDFVVPHTHRIFFDEDLYLGIANSIAAEGKNILCNYGSSTHCIEGILNKDPSGWPFFVAIFYKIFGTSEELAFYISTIIGTISILLVFLITYLFLKNETASLYAALLFSLTPAHIVWSGSVATEIPFTFFSLLTILAYLLYFKNGKFKTNLFAVSLLAFTIQIRPEGSLFILIILLMFILFEKKLVHKLTDYNFFIPWMILFFLITPHLMQMYINRGGDWGAPSGEKFSTKYFKLNSSENTEFFYSGEMHPAFFTILALISIPYFYRKKRILLFNLAWFLLFFTIFVFFYAGNVKSGGIGFRFINIYFSPIIILGGYGAYISIKVLKKILKRSKLANLVILFLIFSSLLFFSDVPYEQFVSIEKFIFPESKLKYRWVGPYTKIDLKVPFPNEKGYVNVTFGKTVKFILVPDPQAQYVRDMHDFVMRNMDRISPDCYVLTHNPSIFLVQGKNSLQTWFGQNTEVMNKVFGKTNCVLWLEGAWCLFEPHKSGVCKNMHDNYNLKIFAGPFHSRENPEQAFTIYKVYRK